MGGGEGGNIIYFSYWLLPWDDTYICGTGSIGHGYITYESNRRKLQHTLQSAYSNIIKYTRSQALEFRPTQFSWQAFLWPKLRPSWGLLVHSHLVRQCHVNRFYLSIAMVDCFCLFHGLIFNKCRLARTGLPQNTFLLFNSNDLYVFRAVFDGYWQRIISFATRGQWPTLVFFCQVSSSLFLLSRDNFLR